MAREERIPLKQRQTDELEARFKPIFDQYEESGGIPLRVLRAELQRQDATKYMDAGNIEVLLQRADTDADGHLEWDEFQRLMTSRTKGGDSGDLSVFQRMVRGAVSSVVPGQERIQSGDLVVDDYISHYNCRPPPLFMILISIAELVVFIVYAVQLKGTPYEITANSGVPLASPLIYNPSRRYEAWRFLTYMFIHSGYMHLIFNLIFQLVLGIPLEMVHKWWRVGIVYSLGVIAGSMGHSIVDHTTLLAGASGGCYSLIGAHIAIVVMNWKEMTHGWMDGPIRFISSAPVRLFLWISMAAIDTGLAIYNRHTGSGKQNVGYAAHFAGALAGLLIGIPVLKNIHVKPWEKVVWWVALVCYLLCIIFAILFNIFYPKFPETDWRKCCPMPKY